MDFLKKIMCPPGIRNKHESSALVESATNTAMGIVDGGGIQASVDATFHVFLCHNSKDKPSVRQLKKRLTSDYRLVVWFDEDQLRPGIPWQKPLEEGIERSHSIAVLVGADGLGPWEDEEMQAALRLAVTDGRAIVPVLLPNALSKPKLPMFLANRTWVDLRGGLKKDNLDRLVWGITGIKPTG